ncbi:MAG: hypothetical protein D6731_03080 [Planctomycetota bacterium]|nr:MAG: hypothetical protein D6731_03080 [Planctomycetota bacterium]
MRPPLLLVPILLLAAGAARGDTVYLKDGRVLSGRVVDQGDRLFVEHPKYGGISVDREDVIRVDRDAADEPAKREADEVLLKDGRVVRGDVRLSPDGTQVIVAFGDRGEVRHPRTAVDTITWRDGRREKASQGLPEGGGTELERRVRRLVEDLAKVDETGAPDLRTRGAARKALIGLGVFARSYLETLEGEAAERVKPVLDVLDRLEALRRVLPGKVEKKHERIGERLISEDPSERMSALRLCVMEAPHRVGPLLLHVVKTDADPQIRAFCVSQMSALRKFEELAEVLRLPEGPLRLAAAFALGDAGIYAGVPILIEALRLSDPEIRRAAVHKLREYTGQTFGYLPGGSKQQREAAIAKWSAWWNENGRDLVRKGIREVAPNLEGARLTEEERQAARRLWAQAAEIIARDPARAEEPAASPKELAQRRLQLERALDLLRRALDIDPSLSSARMTRAVLLYEELERMEEARAELHRIIDRADFDAGDPDEARKFAYYHLGQIALREQSYRKAILAFSQALSYDEDYLDALVGQADAYLGNALDDRPGERLPTAKRLEALSSARVAFDRALETLERRSKELLETVRELDAKGTKTLEEGQVIQAVRRSRRVLELQKAAVHFKLGRLEAARQKDELALEHYRAAALLDPGNAEYEQARAFWERLARQKQGAGGS